MKAEIEVPNKLNEITLEQYQVFMNVYDQNDSEEFLSCKMVSIFCKIPLSQVLYIKANDITNIVKSINNMFEGKRNFINRFELGGKEFGFIPNLEEMSFGEYVDLDKYITDWKEMHKAMAVMFRPITKKKGERYEIEPYEGSITYADVMKYAPLDVVLGAMVFFYDLGNELSKATLSYLEKEVKEMSTAKKHNSVSSGDGINPSMPSLKETLEGLRILQNSDFFNVLHSSPLKSKKQKSNAEY